VTIIVINDIASRANMEFQISNNVNDMALDIIGLIIATPKVTTAYTFNNFFMLLLLEPCPYQLSIPLITLCHNSPVIAVVDSQLRKKAVNIGFSISSVTTAADSECPYDTLVAPSPQGIGMNVEKPGYFLHCQQGCCLIGYLSIRHYITLLSWIACLCSSFSSITRETL
jgi:hypothetical protein